MKKVLISTILVMALTGCAHDYYDGRVTYTQDDSDCVYNIDENGGMHNRHSKQFNESKQIVYRNTSCADLYATDTANSAREPERKIIEARDVSEKPCDMAMVKKPEPRKEMRASNSTTYIYVRRTEIRTTPKVVKRKYIIVPVEEY